MALGELETSFLQDLADLHQRMVVLAENYLKKSDNATRPVELVNMATEMISHGTYTSGRMTDMMDNMQNPKQSSADQVAMRLKSDYGY